MKQQSTSILDLKPAMSPANTKRESNPKPKTRQMSFVGVSKRAQDYVLGIAAIYGKKTPQVLEDLVTLAIKEGPDATHGKQSKAKK